MAIVIYFLFYLYLPIAFLNCMKMLFVFNNSEFRGLYIICGWHASFFWPCSGPMTPDAGFASAFMRLPSVLCTGWLVAWVVAFSTSMIS